MAFGKNVKLTRTEKNFSLQELARHSGVSASMLSKIERGEKNPTIRVASQIAKALKVPIGYLLDESFCASVSIVRKDQRKIVFDPVANTRSLLVFPSITGTDAIEIFSITMPQGASTGMLPPAGEGVRVYIIVERGTLTAMIDMRAYELHAGDCVLFDANVPHKISNPGREEAQYYTISDRYGMKYSMVTVQPDA